MKVVLLAGGYGSRLSELTDVIPKPMVNINGKPIIRHIMEIYSYYGFNDFYIAAGYKSEVIKDYFLNFPSLSSNFTVNLQSRSIKFHSCDSPDWNVTVVDTGLDTMTGGRLKRLRSYLGSDPFFLTYGDGLCSINISDLYSFHLSHGKMVTLTAVRPPARFGELILKDSEVVSFKEKPQLDTGWINGGFFCC